MTKLNFTQSLERIRKVKPVGGTPSNYNTICILCGESGRKAKAKMECAECAFVDDKKVIDKFKQLDLIAMVTSDEDHS